MELSETVDVLLVEDNPGDVRLTEETFKRNEFDAELHVVTDGQQALEYLMEDEDATRPDLVLLDLNLPKANGLEVLEAIKSDDELKVIPVIVLTSSDAPSDVLACYRRHANAYLSKPLDPDDFDDLMNALRNFWFVCARLPSG